MDVLVCEKCKEIVLPFVHSSKIRKWKVGLFVVDGFVCPACKNATFFKKKVKIEKT